MTQERLGSIIRAIMLVVALTNQILTATGKNPLPFSDEMLYEVLSAVATAVIAIWAMWKDTNLTNKQVEMHAAGKAAYAAMLAETSDNKGDDED